jgi:YVTN family beta-propeller protein
VAFNPTNSEVYVTNLDDETAPVLVINPATSTVTEIFGLSETGGVFNIPQGVAVAPPGNVGLNGGVFVANFGSNTLSFIGPDNTASVFDTVGTGPDAVVEA